MKPRILVTNDDGLYGPGLQPLIRAMRRLGTVTTVVPAQERSADSHSLTLHKPIRVRQVNPALFALNGSPADCTRFGILKILRLKVDLVVSGINRGYNLGEDVVYSGTVAAAMEASLMGIPAIAFSQESQCRLYTAAGAYALKVARLVRRHGLPSGIFLNVNFPATSRSRFKGAEIARLGRRIYSQKITTRSDPRGEEYYWLAGKSVRGVGKPGTDVGAVKNGKVSVTPLRVDNTDHDMLSPLENWGF